ncbi:MAG: GNAT family N-acetyltransferase [Actinomycetota bacterium]|nr:GNAT family N-acetyltransferase [Actinomycetota bacterium]
MREPTPVTLTGRDVALVPLTHEHIPDLVRAGQDELIWQWLTEHPRTTEEMTSWVRGALAEAQRVAFAVMVEGRAMGSTSYLDIDATLGGVEVGWTWYARELWATRVNPECKLLMLGHAFDQLQADRVTLKTDIRNTRSQAAIRKLGAHYDGTLRHHRFRADGSVRDSVYFSILAAEWPEIRERLLARLC